jgi:hypothetical protein
VNDIKDVTFFGAGNAIFTVSNPVQERYTYKIRKPGNDKPCFINLLTGPDNTQDYTYLGIYNPRDHRVILTTKSRYNAQSKPVRVLQWALNLVATDKALPQGYKIQHEGRCCRCGRTLTTPKSIDEGIGPECKGKMNQ